MENKAWIAASNRQQPQTHTLHKNLLMQKL